MISLKDSIEIHTSQGRIFAWLGRMPHEYRSWHPDHIDCQVLHGSMLEVGSEIRCQENLHGKLHSMRFRMTKVDTDKSVEYVVMGMRRGAFEVQLTGDNARFVAELESGSDAPIIGRFFDWVFSRFFQRRIEAMRQHMAEEGRNLKVILEQDSPGGREAG